MDTKDIKQLIKLLESSAISEIEVSKWGRRIRVSRSPQGVVVHGATGSVEMSQSVNSQNNNNPVDEQVTEEAPVVNGVEVLSPMVGTFYRSPSPEADYFVKVGDHVKAGQTLCIIEAMKIMNEVESEVSGVITDIVAENAQPVEYNQPLFIIET